MASTQEGRAWVIKALHPSDPLTTVRGLPDETSSSTVVLQYHNVYRISAPATQTTGTWGFDLTVIPSLLVQAAWTRYDAGGIGNGTANFLNQGFAPPGVPAPTYSQLRAQFNSMGVEAHRLLAFGVTGYQDGPALADQGTLTACQYAVSRRKFFFDRNTAAEPTYPYVGHMRLSQFQEGDLANYDKSQQMPNSYFGESKQGVYMPLRLTHTCQKWTTDADMEKYLPVGAPSISGAGEDMIVPSFPGPAGQPYPSLAAAGYNAALGGLSGDVVYPPLNGIWGSISARNISFQTSFAFYFRVLVEVRVQPGSLLAPQQQMSPPYDPLALASYFRINRELKDAYPADFNDLGKIWEVIKKAASFALPIMSAVPGPIGAVGSAGMGIMKAIDSVSSAAARQGKRQGESVSATEKERVKAALEKSMQRVPQGVVKQRPRKPVKKVGKSNRK